MEVDAMFAADYPFLDIFWTMILFFFSVAWIWVLVGIITDVFRQHDLSGWTKARGHDRARRQAGAGQAGAIRSVRADDGLEWRPAHEIEKAKSLLDSGAITQAEPSSSGSPRRGVTPKRW
jgi:hypothetical protein